MSSGRTFPYLPASTPHSADVVLYLDLDGFVHHEKVLWHPRIGATTAGSNRCSGDPWCGSIFSSRSCHRHILLARGPGWNVNIWAAMAVLQLIFFALDPI